MFKNLMKLLTILSFAVVFNINSIGRDWRVTEVASTNPNQLLIDSAAAGDLKGVQEALDQGADINYCGKYSLCSDYFSPRSAIFHATRYSHLNIVKFLIEKKGVNPNCVDQDGYNLLTVASFIDNLEICEYLLQKGLHKNLLTIDYRDIDNLDTVRFLIWNGISCIKKRDEDLNTTIQRFELVGAHRDKIRFKSDTICAEDRAKLKLQFDEKIELLKKFALKVENLKNKSYKNIVKRVNQYRNNRYKSLRNLKILPAELENLVIGYCEYLFPENPEEFFKISDEDLGILIMEYSVLSEIDSKKKEEFTPAKEVQVKRRCLIM